MPAGALWALVRECARGAPVRIVRWATPDAPPETQSLPSSEASGFEPLELRAAPDGTPVVAGAFAGHVAVARPADGAWRIAPSDWHAVLVQDLVVDARGSAWVLALGTRDGHDDWMLLRERGDRLERLSPREGESTGAEIRVVGRGFSAGLS